MLKILLTFTHVLFKKQTTENIDGALHILPTITYNNLQYPTIPYNAQFHQKPSKNGA